VPALSAAKVCCAFDESACERMGFQRDQRERDWPPGNMARDTQRSRTYPVRIRHMLERMPAARNGGDTLDIAGYRDILMCLPPATYVARTVLAVDGAGWLVRRTRGKITQERGFVPQCERPD